MVQDLGGPRLVDLQYKVVQTLGAGAGSRIFLISDTKLGAKYALKVVKRQEAEDEKFLAQAVHEYEVAQRLNHVNILKVHDCRVKRNWFRTTGVDLLMEYVEGRTLDDLPRPDLGQLVLIFIHVAAALKHMHRRGVYHGDLKPGNLMLSKEGVVKVIDFGTAWIKGQPKDRVQGTPQYMAPEQANARVVDERTDLYNLGATMYRMLTGEYANVGIPNGAESAFGRRFRVKAPMDLNPDVPGTLNEAIMGCLEPDPDRRPAGAFEVKHHLVATARYLGLKPGDLKGSEPEHDD